MSDRVSMATMNAIIDKKVTSSPIKSTPFKDTTNKEVFSIPSGVKSISKTPAAVEADVVSPPPTSNDVEVEIESLCDHDIDDDIDFDAYDLLGMDFEEVYSFKGKGKKTGLKHMSGKERHKTKRAAAKTAKTRSNAAAAKKNAKTKRKSQQVKSAVKFELQTNSHVDLVVGPTPTMVVACAPCPVPSVRKIIPDAEYAKCVHVAPALPSLEPISLNVNVYAVLHERIAVMPEAALVVVAGDGILVRALRFVRGLAARAGAWVKKGLKAVQHLISC